MGLLNVILRKREQWVELEPLYTRERVEAVSAVLREHQIPYRVRAALLPVPLHAAAPLGTAGQSLWHLSVHPEDVTKAAYCLRKERMG